MSGIDVAEQRLRVHELDRVVIAGRFLDNARGDASQVNVRAVGLHDPSGHAVQVQEVREEPMQLPSVRREAAQKVLAVLWIEAPVIVLERQRGPENAGKGCPQIV